MPTQPEQLPVQPDAMSVDQAAKMLGWGPDTLWKVIRAGDIEVIRLGPGKRKTTWVTRKAVMDYVDRNTHRAQTNKRARQKPSA